MTTQQRYYFLAFSGGSSPWATTGEISDNMLEDQNKPEEGEKRLSDEERKVEEDNEDNMLEDGEGSSSNHLMEQSGIVVIDNQAEPMGNMLEKQEDAKMREREPKEGEDDKMKKASDNVESGAVRQNLGEGTNEVA